MKKPYAILGVAALTVICIGIALVALSNLRSPESTKNLLSYWWYHSTSKECKVVSQKYENRVVNDKYDQECIKRKCIERYGSANTLCTNYYWGNIDWNDCVISTKVEKTPVYDETDGEQEIRYYLGIPIQKSFCPTGYTPTH